MLACLSLLPLIAQASPQIGSLPVLRLRGGEAGLPAMSGTEFGSSVAVLNSMLAVGKPASPGLGGTERGSVWVITMLANGSATAHVEIGDGAAPSEGGAGLLGFFGVLT